MKQNSVSMRVEQGYIQWQIDGDNEWNNLIAVEDITGADGIGIQTITINNKDELVIKYTNGEEENLGVVVGNDGKDGIGIKDVEINEEGHLIITLSNDETIDAGLVVGQNGKEVEIRVNEGYIQWKYEDETEWTNLISLDDISGVDGEDGIGIDSVTINDDLELIITYTNGEENNLGIVVGEDGVDGIGIKDVEINEEGHLIITLSNDETIDAGLVVGQNGKEVEIRVNEGYIQWKYENETEWTNLISLDDISGVDGEDGIGIDSVKINDDLELIITYTNGEEFNLGVVVGEDGVDGIGIKDVEINDEGHLIITLSNDETIDAGLVVGQNGKEVEIRVNEG